MLAVLAVGLLFLLPGGPAWAQDAGTIEYPENGTGSVATYTATDPEGTAINSWTLAGTDADAFTIEGGVLRFVKTPDYETAADVRATDGSTAAAGDNEYEITVQAMDGTGKTGMQEVTVEVIDVDEAGTVTLSARRPLVGVAFTASPTDLDGDVTNDTWQWAKSRSKNGSYTDIDNAETATYQPTDATGKSDVGYYLRATASYTDPEGSGKTAMMKSEYTVQATRGTNNAPKFADDQDPVMDEEQPRAARKVAENTAAGTDIGAPVVAADDDNDILTYTLEDAEGGIDGDSASFAIDWATGQLMTKAALDFEATPSYTVVVRATDPDGVPAPTPRDEANSDVVTVDITVTNVNEAPSVTGEAGVTFAETAGDINAPLNQYVANDPETTGDNAGDVTWSVAGLDGGKFTATGGELKFKAKPDYENPTDANTDNVYEVTVQATDANGNRGMKKVKVTVTNEEEDGVVTLSKTQPRVGIAVTASLTDPDGSISNLTWKWSDGTTEIKDANSDTYTPVGQRGDDENGDVGDTLTATASYTDGEGASRMAMETSANVVAVDTRNKPPAFVDQDTETDGIQNTMSTREVDENTKADATDDAPTDGDATTDNVGAVVTATDPDPNAETPTYTLGGTDAAKFRVRDNGQIEVGSGTMLDYEAKQTYMVTLTAEDSFGSSSSIAVTIMVNPIDEVPDVSGEETIEYPENGTGSVATYTATDPEGTAINSWTLAGTDADAFTIEGGVLRFVKTPDYETAADVRATDGSTAAAGDNEYEITVQAMDGTGKTGMQEVTVEVIDVDEAGTVTLSARRPLVGVAFTASPTDLDGDVTNDTWQWAKSRSKNGSYTDIDNAETATYQPTDATGKSDVGYYLRATASYTDPEGSGKTAMMKSEYTVQATRGTNNAPKFADDQDPVMDEEQPRAARKVAENTAAGTDIGAPVVAADDDNDILTYTLEDAEGGIDGDSASFAIDWATGQLMTKAALDFEATPSYTVVVRATDPDGVPAPTPRDEANSDVVTVDITVTNVNEAPSVTGEAGVTFAETAGDINAPLNQYVANDPETTGDNAGDVTWSVAGLDGGKFTATGGELKFKAKPDYENPTDANTDNVYEVTVQATDANGNRGMKKVKVTVTNEEEDGVVTLSKTQPRVGIAVTASLTDPDGSISNLTWKWSVGTTPIEDANSDTYTPVGQRGDDKSGDVGDTLTATASYTDGEGASRMAMETSANVVAVDTRNKPPAFVDQDTETDGIQNTMSTREVDENTKADATDDAPTDGDATTDNVGAVVTATDPDPNAETPTYTLGGTDAAKFRVRDNGQIEVGSGTMLDYEAKQTYMVTLTAEDSFGSSSSIAVTIMVNPIDEVPEIMKAPDANVAPEFASATTSRTVAENTVAGKDIGNPVAVNDANGDALTYGLSGTDAASFDIDTDTGQLMTLAALDYETKASYSVTVTASDSGGLSDTIDVTVTVTNVDEAPVITGDAALDYAENGTDPVAPYLATDPESANITWSLEGDDAADLEISAGGELSFASAPNYENAADADTDNTYMVTVVASDGTNDERLAVTVTVTNVDEAPVITGDAALDYAENGTNPVATYSATDPESANITWTLEGDDAADFEISAGGELSFASAPNYENAADADTDNTYSVTVTASDSGGLSDSIDVTVTVTNVDEGFEVSGPAEVDYAENGTDPVAPYLATDPESANVTWTLEGDDAADFEISAGGELSFASAPNYENAADADTDNTYMVTVVASDGTNEERWDVTVTVTNVDEAPVITGDAALDYAENGTNPVATYSATDPESANITWTLEGDDAADFEISAGGELSFASAPNYENAADADTDNTYSVTVTASDSGGLSDSIDVTVTVTNVDEGFEVSGPAEVDYAENGTDPVAPYLATDPESANVTWTLEGDDAADFEISAGGELSFASAPNYENAADADTDNTYMVTVVASDGTNEDRLAVTVTVTNVDEAPVITGDAALDYAENGTDPVAPYLATDPESANITWSLEGDDAADFEISAGGELSFASAPNYENAADADTDNTYMVTVVASDGTNEDRWDVTVTVTNVDEDVDPADPLVDRYDANDNDEIERSEVFAAIDDYLDGDAGAPSRADVFKLIELYLGD